jgi:F-type H+-transporting ATPase subunit b
MLRPLPISACELKNKVAATLVAALLSALLVPAALAAQTPEHAPPPPAGAHAPATQPGGHGEADAEHAEGEEHGMFSGLLWPTINFAILAGGLWWFFKDPVAGYLRDRHTSIRKDLVDAASVKSAAAAQLAEIDRKLQALPGEIDALKKRGAEEIAAEEQRIAAQAASERDRLLEQTRREIDVQLRLAKRELVEHAANLSVQLAGDRLQQQMTADDQKRLVDRYVDQVTPRQA